MAETKRMTEIQFSVMKLVLREVHRDTVTETARVGLRLLVRCNVLKYVMSTALT